MRTTLSLDDDVYRAALQLSQSSGEGLGKVVSHLIRRGLAPVAPKQGRGHRFPVFHVSPGAPVITVESIDKFIEEEGLV